MYLYPYKTGSEGAKQLALALNIKRIKHNNSNFKGSPMKQVINWGAGTLPDEVLKCDVINHPDDVKEVSNKLTFFQKYEGVCNLPEYTTEKEVAAEWLDNGSMCVCRKVLTGSGGEGIVMALTRDELVDAPLYTKYVKKKDEYRIHFFNGEVFDVQRKARALEVVDDKVNWQVRNHENGFVFVRQDVVTPPSVSEEAKKFIEATGLDFGAIDIIYNAKEDKGYILEVNTAPGLTGTTLENYVKEFQNV